MTKIVFDFDNAPALAARENIAYKESDGVVVRFHREMRVEPLPGMKQPLLNKAIMGMETLLSVSRAGKPTKCKWKLYKTTPRFKLLQRGTTNANGQSGNIKIGMGSIGSFRIEVDILEL